MAGPGRAGQHERGSAGRGERTLVLGVILLWAVVVTLSATGHHGHGARMKDSAGHVLQNTKLDLVMNWMQQLRDSATSGTGVAAAGNKPGTHAAATQAVRREARQIMAYHGYANESYAWVTGRVLANPPLNEPTASDSWWDNLRATWQRWETDELGGVDVQLRFGDDVQQVTTDGEGYYHARFHRVPDNRPVLEVDARCQGEDGELQATHSVFVPDRDAEYLVISDIDDTVLHTGITTLWTAARLTFLGNAKTRKPLKGVAGLYRALESGKSGGARNPVFYVSNSGWNLYDLLARFITLNDLPEGPILLRDLGIPGRSAGSRTHKQKTLTRLMQRYAGYPVILVGDSGQHDAEVYASIAKRFPGRVLAVYIRDVDPGSTSKYDARVDSIIEDLSGGSVPMLRGEDSRSFADHLERLGLLPRSAKSSIAGSAIRDEQRERFGK